MARARGANALLAMAFNSGAYGGVPGSGFVLMPFTPTFDLGEEQALIKSDLLGYGRDPQDPTPDVINNRGNKVVPLDVRAFGYHLKALFGAPTTTRGIAASGSATFSAQPANDATLTIGGVDWTFKASGATGTASNKGATLLDTLTAAVLGLNASADSTIAANRYELSLDGASINIKSKTIGTGGNSVTLALSSSPASNATLSGSTLAGGSASGPYNHVFQPGLTLPDYALELGLPDVPSYHMNYGCVDNTLSIPLQRSGLVNATIGVIAQGEAAATGSTAAGTPSSLAIDRFGAFSGYIQRDGVPLGDIVSGNVDYSNGLDPVEVIRPDGRIAGVDPGPIEAGLKATVRYKSSTMRDLATNNTPISARVGWSRSASQALYFDYHRLFLPRPKRPISSAGGVMEEYATIAAEHATRGTITSTLINDVSSYA